MSLICLIHAHIEPRTDSDLWTFLAGPSPLQAEQSHLGSAVAGASANDSKQTSAMEAVIAAEAEGLAAPLHGTQTLLAGLVEQNMAQGKAASP